MAAATHEEKGPTIAAEITCFEKGGSAFPGHGGTGRGHDDDNDDD